MFTVNSSQKTSASKKKDSFVYLKLWVLFIEIYEIFDLLFFMQLMSFQPSWWANLFIYIYIETGPTRSIVSNKIHFYRPKQLCKFCEKLEFVWENVLLAFFS